MGKKKLSILTVLFAAFFMLGLTTYPVYAEGEADYTHPATATDESLEVRPGVYYTTVDPGEGLEEGETVTIGIPSVAKQTLADQPTTESPAIIMGAAVGFETRINRADPMDDFFEELNPRVAPYSYFRTGVIEEKVKDVKTGEESIHKKLSGFDGSYYIIRVDVSALIEEKGENQYLHVKQESNKALMVAFGMDGTTFSDALGNKTGSYSLANQAKALKDNGDPSETPYFDVIVMSSGKLAAGADAGQEGAPSSDIKLSFYVDDTEDYKPALQVLDANNMPTFPYTVGGETFQTETDYNKALLAKFFNDENATADNNASKYIVKDSDLEIDVMVDEQENLDEVNEFWSLTNAFGYEKYDSHIVKLICEVPVLEGLSIEGTPDIKRSVILDVNSFDIQIANNKEQNKAALTIDADSQLRIMDSSKTSGAELAIGNNATMVIKKGGTLVIDESCTNEVEYDAATITDPTQQPEGQQVNGEITIEGGGTLINYGVVNIEGTEVKPLDPTQSTEGQTPITDTKTSDIVVEHGGLFENYGCISLKGTLYVLGTLNNYGRYTDTIVAQDPDKGTTTYHKGIQLTWKDVVTQKDQQGNSVEPGILNVGIDAKGEKDTEAVLNNYGDIVMFPGTFNLYGTFNNTKKNETDEYVGHLYICTVDEAIIPIIDPNDPLNVEKLVKVDPPKKSVFNSENGVVNNEGIIGPAKVELNHNGVPGDIILPSLENGVVIVSDEAVYTGSVQTPVLESVMVGANELVADRDYSVILPEKPLQDAGTYTLRLVGKGTCVGEKDVIYTIKPKKITPTVSLSANTFTYDGNVKTPTVTVKDGTKVLKKGTDYTETFAAGRINVGTYKVTVNLKGNYFGTKEASFKITAKSVTPTVTFTPSKATYDGKMKTPSVKVTVGTKVLKKGTDYTVKLASGRKNAGKYKVTVTMKGNYTGKKTATFTIQKATNKLKVTGKTAKVRLSSVQKSDVAISTTKAFNIANKGTGNRTFTKSSGNPKIVVNRTTGKITVKKGLKAGTYTIKVKVTAAGNANYNAVAKDVKVKIVVKK